MQCKLLRSRKRERSSVCRTTSHGEAIGRENLPAIQNSRISKWQKKPLPEPVNSLGGKENVFCTFCSSLVHRKEVRHSLEPPEPSLLVAGIKALLEYILFLPDVGVGA